MFDARNEQNELLLPPSRQVGAFIRGIPSKSAGVCKRTNAAPARLVIGATRRLETSSCVRRRFSNGPQVRDGRGAPS